MKFTELDARMRVFETAHDHCVLPGITMVARLDGRGFTRLTRQVHRFRVPFDPTFRDLMVATTQHLMDSGFRVIYSHTHSDEVSLLFHPGERSFARKLRKYNSILAGEASAKFSCLLGDIACFDCRVSQLPRPDQVIDYFRWRQEDAHRNSLNAHCYWALRRDDQGPQAATGLLKGMSVAEKNELLFQRGINFNDLPKWQKRGVGLYWEDLQKPAVNPKTGEKVVAIRREIKVDLELPMKDEYDHFIQGLLDKHT